MSETRHDTGRGLSGDISRLRTNGAASAEEIREFVSKLRGRSPSEMLGVVAESGLFKSMVVATVGCVVLIGALTVGPYLWAKSRGSESTTAASTSKKTKPAAETKPEPKPTPNDVAAQPANTGVDPERAVEALGIGETKEAPTDGNPLDDKLDDLLDGLE